MAQPTHQYPPRAYPSPQPPYSPHPGAYPPPSKRPRLSPNPQSPHSSPNVTNGTLPNQIFSSPYPIPQPNGVQSHMAYDQQHAPPTAGTMGPPSRPMDKITDMTELTDVLAGSGVDLREEEAALVNRFSTSNYQGSNFQSAPISTTTFNQPGSSRSMVDPYLAHGGFDVLSRNFVGNRDSFYGAGTFNQAATPFKSEDEELEQAQKRAIRIRSERKQYHLNDPFLFGATVQRSIAKHAHSTQVTVSTVGLFKPERRTGQRTQMAVAGPDKHEILTVLQGEDLLYQDAPLSDILTLVSYAAQERLRVLIEDTAALAKGRRTSSHGIVPPELADLSVGRGLPESVTALSTPGHSAVSPKTNPLKRPLSISDIPVTVSEITKTPSNAIAFPNQLAHALRKVSKTEQTLEEARRVKREKRTANGASNEVAGAGLVSGGTGATGTPGFLGERAPDMDTKKGVSKKEQKRQAEVKATEAQQHADTNKTMNMQLSLGGVMGKKLSWMTTKDSSSGTRGFPVPPRASSGFQGQSKNSVNAVGHKDQVSGKKSFGDFREDRETGLGIQMRDVVAVLEPEPKERRALARAYSKLGSQK